MKKIVLGVTMDVLTLGLQECKEIKKFVCLIAVFLLCGQLSAREYHVSVKGRDTNAGSLSAPFQTIQAAADKAMPGDVVIVHEGVYRERVAPPRGGTSNKMRIIYQAAPGEQVTITGSEPVKGWSKMQDDVWKLTLPNSFFGEGNPFDELIYGSWYRGKGRPNHTGNVFLNRKRIRETFSLESLLHSDENRQGWYAEADGSGGPVLMNFEWIQPAGGQRMTSMQASVDGGDQAVCIAIVDRWPFGYLKDGSVMYFEGVDFASGTDTLFYQAATLAKGGIVEMHLGAPDGELLGSSMVTNTGDWEQFAVFPMKMSRKLAGKQDICLVLKAPDLKVDGKTTLWVKFPNGIDPNKESVEITVRPQVFYPDKTGIDFITVRGFTLENAATNWAPPSAEQPGLIGPRWAKGWIIENNTIRNSRCSGISLGRPTYGHAHHYQKELPVIYPEPDAGQSKEQLADYFANASWTKEEAGFHIVRNNHIYECGQAGIVGCSGGAFSLIEGNEIHDVCLDETFEGDEMAGIKLHFANDAVIKDNHIYKCIRGIWIDWGATGMQIVGNLLHNNDKLEDLFIEVCHGPTLVANNICLSGYSICLSQGIACIHNIATGKIFAGIDRCAGGRKSFIYEPHGTVSVGNIKNNGGDLQWYNNLLSDKASLNHWDEPQLPLRFVGNVFSNGAEPSPDDKSYLLLKEFVPDVKLEQKEDGWYLSMNVSKEWKKAPCKLMTTKNIENAITPDLPFINPDDSKLKLDFDYWGNKRKGARPFPGAIEMKGEGRQEWKVWPKE